MDKRLLDNDEGKAGDYEHGQETQCYKSKHNGKNNIHGSKAMHCKGGK